MQHIIETSVGNRTLVEIGSDCDYVTPMLEAYKRDVLAHGIDPGWVAAYPLGRTDYVPFEMKQAEIVAEIARRKALR